MRIEAISDLKNDKNWILKCYFRFFPYIISVIAFLDFIDQ